MGTIPKESSKMKLLRWGLLKKDEGLLKDLFKRSYVSYYLKEGIITQEDVDQYIDKHFCFEKFYYQTILKIPEWRLLLYDQDSK